MKNRARDLLLAVADGGDVSIARVYDFARAVIEAPAFQTAQEIVQGGSPEFAVRRALGLASMVLSIDDGAAERVAPDVNRELAEIGAMFAVFRAVKGEPPKS